MPELPSGFSFRRMEPADVSSALQIIGDHDEDDYEWAQATYEKSLDGQYVLTDRSQLIGVTGAKLVPNTDRTYTISWHYLQRSYIGQGNGGLLLESLLDVLRGQNARKVFVHTSDYLDPEEGDVYLNARQAYRSAGFTEELRHHNFYDENETLITLGLRLEQQRSDEPVLPNEQKIRWTDIDAIDECEGAYWLAWELDDEGTEVSGFQTIFDHVRQWHGRVIFAVFPSDVVAARDFMTRGNFRPDGMLKDYYEDGVDEIHYRYDLI